MESPIKMAILDMYDGEPNQGMRCIIDIVNRFRSEVNFKVYDVRGKSELPALANYDVFISSGGPGNPLDGDGLWDRAYFAFLDELWAWNKESEQKKHMLFICHSFQMACKHFGLAEITKRKSTSFGVMTIHKTPEGTIDPLFENLDNPFYAVDSRDYQVVQPRLKKFRDKGATILALEKIRSHVEYERAIMGVRFSDYIVGIQFHPEADPISFVMHLKKKEARDKIIALKGRTKFRNMLEDLVDENKIFKTNETLIPNFIKNALKQVKENKSMLSL
ncbi:type 1 glutamine amidotransferase [Pararhodonellum marinum]|uniref:type 1 glutamine amidotransferase n=1 Tax=Pararhodonellum marinum TaxID=2755358 RepID=UPI00188F5368|nr:GMP synthase [Pararhodonellum marinum]